jgi:hypothetical protein
VTGPVFCFTAHRSGGTALARGLNRHPDLMIWGEHAGFINKLAELDATVGRYPVLTQALDRRGLDDYVRLGKFDPGAFDPWRNPFERADFRDWCRRFLETTFRRGLHAGQRWGFKEVRYHTTGTARFLAELFPDARFVLLRRPLGALVLSNMLSPWSIGQLRQLGVTSDPAELRAAVRDCAYALTVVDRGLANIARALPERARQVQTQALDAPAETFAGLFDFFGLPHWPALLDEVREAIGRRTGVTDLTLQEGILSREAVLPLIPEALAAAASDLAAGGPDPRRLKRLGATGRYSFLAGDHDVLGTPFSTLF